METVFITIHDLSLDARIKYCSDSVEEILGYSAEEVKGKSCWEYFHPDEIPFAQAIHGRGVNLDKAAVLNYCRVKHKDGRWIGCECVFTVVYDVLVASTAIYQRGPKSQKRAIDGASVRRIFSSSPRDPRYHMLSYISNKFYQEPQLHTREPRAALFLNRFSRTLPIMFATNGVANILGIQPSQLVKKSFYFCVAENCLHDAVRCIESAKGNDSIAYLRFWYRDPTQEQERRARELSLALTESSDEDDDGGVSIGSEDKSTTSTDMASPSPLAEGGRSPMLEPSFAVDPEKQRAAIGDGEPRPQYYEPVQEETQQSRSSSGNSTDLDANSHNAIFDSPSLQHQSSASSSTPNEEQQPIEIEAVVSCTSDGLVLVLRRAKPLVPFTAGITDTPYYANGLFASPWAAQPMMPPGIERTTVAPSITFPPSHEPVESGFMAAIRDVAVFAWSLTGINGSLAAHGHGAPRGEALPAGGLPVWDPNALNGDDRWNGYSSNTHRRIEDLEPHRKEEDVMSSDDEVVYRRVAQQPPWRKPKRRAHHDAFGMDGDLASHDGSLIRRRKLDGGK